MAEGRLHRILSAVVKIKPGEARLVLSCRRATQPDPLEQWLIEDMEDPYAREQLAAPAGERIHERRHRVNEYERLGHRPL